MPENVIKDLVIAMQRSEGTFFVEFENAEIMDDKIKHCEILCQASGSHIFVIERDADMKFRLCYSSTSGGSREAVIDLKNEFYCRFFKLLFTWSVNSIQLFLVLMYTPDLEMKLSAAGVASKVEYRLGEDGVIYKIEYGQGEFLSLHFYSKNELVLTSRAISLWGEAKQAAEGVLGLESLSGREWVTINSAITIIVTGFEVYTKNRIIEIEKEGIVPDVESMIKNFSISDDRRAELMDVLDKKNCTLLSAIVKKGYINFQSFDRCNLAFKKAYGIKFGEVGLDSEKIEAIKTLIRHRHRVVHVHPLAPFFAKRNGKEGIELIDIDDIKKFIGLFDEFIKAIHKASLELKRKD